MDEGPCNRVCTQAELQAAAEKCVAAGASPRAAQTLLLAAKVRALRDGRDAVGHDDIKAVVLPAMRHRCILNFEAEAEGITTDQVLQNIIDTVPADVPTV